MTESKAILYATRKGERSSYLPTSTIVRGRGGGNYWMPEGRALGHFCYAYGALFGIPSFVGEAVAMQPDRFSEKRLPLTIRSTTGFILDAYGFDRRTGRRRSVLYAPDPDPVIRCVHAASHGKNRISDAPMAYFGAHLFFASERSAPHDAEHFDYIASFFHGAGYRFPPTASEARHYVHYVDDLLAGAESANLWINLCAATRTLGVDLGLDDLIEFLPQRSSRLCARTLTEGGLL